MERLGEQVRGELGRLGPGGAIAEIVAAWPRAVGPEVARNAWPARLARDGTLHVNTSSSSWAFELTQLEAVVREQVAARLGGAAPPGLRFAPGPLPEPETAREPETTRIRVEPSPEAVAEADRLAAAVDSEVVRGAVARAAALSLEKARAGRSF